MNTLKNLLYGKKTLQQEMGVAVKKQLHDTYNWTGWEMQSRLIVS